MKIMEQSIYPKYLSKKRKKVISIFLATFSFLFFNLNSEIGAETNNPSSNIEKTLNKEINMINNDAYLLGPGDTLTIIFYGAEEFNSNYEILNDGSLSLPLIGSVQVDGLSIKKANEEIEKLYENELLMPKVDCTLNSSRAVRVSVIGEINNPGIYKMSGGRSAPNQSEISTVVDALIMAGGVSEEADLTRIKLIRKMSREKGFKKQTELNLLSLILEGDQSQNLILFDGDIIQLPKTLESKDSFKIAASNISPESINIRVIGSVNNPGPITMKSQTTLSQAVLSAGGTIDWRTNKSNIQLIRINQNGSASMKKYRLDLSGDASKDNNPILKDGDIVKVNASFLDKTVKATTVFTEPLREAISIYTLVKILE